MRWLHGPRAPLTAAEVDCDGDGRAVVHGLPRSNYEIVVRAVPEPFRLEGHPRFVLADRDVEKTIRFRAGGSVVGRVRVPGTLEGPAAVSVYRLENGHSVPFGAVMSGPDGTFRFEGLAVGGTNSLHGVIRDADGRPLVNAWACARPAEDHGWVRFARTDGSGRYRLPGLAGRDLPGLGGADGARKPVSCDGPGGGRDRRRDGRAGSACRPVAEGPEKTAFAAAFQAGPGSRHRRPSPRFHFVRPKRRKGVGKRMASEAVGMEFIAVSPSMREVLQQVHLVRDSGVAVLVTGEAGSGKEKVARTIHHTGIRCREPFVHVDCSELPGDVLGAVLFGERDEGRFELAAAGTLFLDGIDTLALDLQQRLLEVLERGTITRDGGKQIAPVQARLVAATHRDLRELVDEDTFRKDLFCRLNVFPIVLPPLRDRREDIAGLAQHFLACHQHERTPPVESIEERAMAALKAYGWPQNVRELETVVLGAILACDSERVVRLENLPAEVRALAPATTPSRPAPAPTPQLDDDEIVPLAELERRAIAHALRVTGGNVTRAARALGIGRATMYRKLDRFKLTTS